MPATRTPPPSKHLGANIQAARIASNMTQEDLARAIGYKGTGSRASICLIESGQREPRLDLLAKIARALDVSLDVLLSKPAK